MSHPFPQAALQDTLQAYLNGETGIHFEALADFAEPLFDLYAVDLRAAQPDLPATVRDTEELASLLAVMETARLFWAYFALGQDESRRRLPALISALLGPRPDEAAHLAFLELLSILEAQWYYQHREGHLEVPVPGYTLPPFDLLLEQYIAGAEHRPDRYGAEQLELPDALALFARPLLEAPGILEDPELLEQTLSRANAYWELAQAPAEMHEKLLADIVRTFASGSDEAASLRQEAAQMVARFFLLFPEHDTRS